MRTQNYQGSYEFMAAFTNAKHDYERATGKPVQRMFVSASDLKNLERDLDTEGNMRLTNIVAASAPRLEVMGIRTCAVVEDGVMVAT